MRTLDKLNIDDLVAALASVVDELNKATQRKDAVAMRVYGKRLHEGSAILASKLDAKAAK